MSDNRPNIIWITDDQHRYDSLGCNSNDVVTTPNLDELASNGVRFSNCFTVSPVCACDTGIPANGAPSSYSRDAVKRLLDVER